MGIMLRVMMNPQERKRQERDARRHRIQDAARPVFFERGFARASIEEIARQAQLSVGAIYLYFKSKEDLYLSILERSLGGLGAAVATTGDPRDAWACLEAWHQAEPESARALAMIARPDLRATLSDDVTARLALALAGIRTGLAGAVSHAVASRQYRPCDAGTVADALWAGFIGALAVDAMTGNVGGLASPPPGGLAMFAVVDGQLRIAQSVRAAA